VITLLDLAPRPSNELHPVREGGELAALLELFGPADTDVAPTRPSFRASVSTMLGWAQDSSRRAARWGAVSVVQQ
jgi:hypothetical protein